LSAEGHFACPFVVCRSTVGSGDADPADVQFEGAGPAGGDHQPDLADARWIERWRVADLTSAEAGAKVGQRQIQGLPVGACGAKLAW
jgi:hypothetical protein